MKLQPAIELLLILTAWLFVTVAIAGCAPERDPNQPPQQNLYSVPPRFVKCPICGNVAELKSVGAWKGAQYNCTAGHSITATNDGAGNWEFNSAQLSK